MSPPRSVEAQGGEYASLPVWLDVGGVGHGDGAHAFCRVTTEAPTLDLGLAAPELELPGGVEEGEEHPQDMRDYHPPSGKCKSQNIIGPRCSIHSRIIWVGA